jgi:hypothetical protein
MLFTYEFVLEVAALHTAELTHVATSIWGTGRDALLGYYRSADLYSLPVAFTRCVFRFAGACVPPVSRSVSSEWY